MPYLLEIIQRNNFHGFSAVSINVYIFPSEARATEFRNFPQNG